MQTISEPNRVYLETVIDKEGFHYAFTGYSDFKEVQDEKFHALRNNYLKSMEELAKYMKLDTKYWG